MDRDRQAFALDVNSRWSGGQSNCSLRDFGNDSNASALLRTRCMASPSGLSGTGRMAFSGKAGGTGVAPALRSGHRAWGMGRGAAVQRAGTDGVANKIQPPEKNFPRRTIPEGCRFAPACLSPTYVKKGARQRATKLSTRFLRAGEAGIRPPCHFFSTMPGRDAARPPDARTANHARQDRLPKVKPMADANPPAS